MENATCLCGGALRMGQRQELVHVDGTPPSRCRPRPVLQGVTADDLRRVRFPVARSGC